MKKSSIEIRRDAIKARLVFGEVALEMGLSGSSRAGWDCPACCGERTLKERPDHQGGRCAACDTGQDIIGLVMAVQHESFLSSLLILERLADKKEAAAATGAGDLFGGAA